MKLNLYVLTPKQIIWDCEVKEIVLSTNSGQIGVLPNQAPINTTVDMGPLRICLLNNQWLTAVLWSELGSDIDPEEAQKALEIAEANLNKAECTKDLVEAKLALRRARIRIEAVNCIPPSN
ncbi:unnamed protein product [Triticum turgidum subsp. durum]|uniref:ATP synthase epsilon chain, chloroplastic n=1 Tax=Triticum turgidum subsp. durum TaxID=4567 RepID=A0A9R0VZQ1_TRITD|nr:unnamed protein product [Triticum turgidum subsp. durum]